MKIDYALQPTDLKESIKRLWELSGEKIQFIETDYDASQGSPVFTVRGKYTSHGWTEWTQGFQYGSSILQFDATGDERFLDIGRAHTVASMAAHVSHTGVHDHGFNNVSTYGNLLRLINHGRIPKNEWEKRFYELALKLSGAVQAFRWTDLPGDLGFVYSFNGPHSLFADTVRSMRALALSHRLGHVLMGEQEARIHLLERMLRHMETTALYTVYFGEGRDRYDVCGRVAHEVIFNVESGAYRCPNSQQGYSPFSTWTRGLAWILLGFTEQLEFLSELPENEFNGLKAGTIQVKQAFLERFTAVSEAVADFYIEYTPADGIPYWDTGAPGLAHMGDYLNRPADPFNEHEPVDSSAAAIAAQGLLRLGHYLSLVGRQKPGNRYTHAGLTVANTLFKEPYISTDRNHQGLILHSVYHRPYGWDYIPHGKKIPCGESSMWGDYHARELALTIQRLNENSESYYRFFT